MDLIVKPGHAIDAGQGPVGPGGVVTVSDKEGARLITAGLAESMPKTRDEPDRMARIIAVIGTLDRDNDELWTGDHRPQVSALETALGEKISAADRDAAWKTVLEQS